MPIVHVKSLPMPDDFDAQTVLRAIAEDFAGETGVAVRHVTVTWAYFQAHHYALAGATFEQQGEASRPVLVDLLIPDFNTAERVENMLRVLAASISRHARLASNNVFVHARLAASGTVFDDGDIVRW